MPLPMITSRSVACSEATSEAPPRRGPATLLILVSNPVIWAFANNASDDEKAPVMPNVTKRPLIDAEKKCLVA